MKPLLSRSLALLILALAAPAMAKQTRVGWVERIGLAEVGMIVKAKMDTGAKTSSVDAEIIDIRKTGEKKKGVTTGDTIVFSITLEDGSKKTFERAVKRYVRIKRKEAGGYIRRPVIEMKFCIGDMLVQEEVNLANRENFLYPVLVGRNMMQHAGLIVDASQTHLSRPKCKNKEVIDSTN